MRLYGAHKPEPAGVKKKNNNNNNSKASLSLLSRYSKEFTINSLASTVLHREPSKPAHQRHVNGTLSLALQLCLRLTSDSGQQL